VGLMVFLLILTGYKKPDKINTIVSWSEIQRWELVSKGMKPDDKRDNGIDTSLL